MKNTQNQTWEAIYAFLPHLRGANSPRVIVNLPDALRLAAVEIFILQNAHPTTTSLDPELVAAILDAITELRSAGSITFA